MPPLFQVQTETERRNNGRRKETGRPDRRRHPAG